MRLTFGDALKAAKEGAKISRHEWGNTDQFVVYQKGYPDGIPCNKQTAEAWGMKEGELFKCKPYLQIRCVDGSHMMWTPSISDILEEDWYILSTAETNCKEEPVSQSSSLSYYSIPELVETNCFVLNAKDILDIKYTNNISTEEAAERYDAMNWQGDRSPELHEFILLCKRFSIEEIVYRVLNYLKSKEI